MQSESTKFIKRCAEFVEKDESSKIPKATRGLYALLQQYKNTDNFDVVYVGMTSRSSIGRRIARHKLSSKKWSHFSIFEVHPKVSEGQLTELEGLFREIYRKDRRANVFNKQKKFKKLQRVREDNLDDWREKS